MYQYQKNQDLHLPTSITEDILSVKRQESTASCMIFVCECGEKIRLKLFKFISVIFIAMQNVVKKSYSFPALAGSHKSFIERIR